MWRGSTSTPALPGYTPRWQRMAASLSHWSLYAVTILVFGAAGRILPVPARRTIRIGSLHVPGSPRLTGSGPAWEDRHILFAYVPLALIAVHPGAALWHHFVRRDRVTARMIDGKGARSLNASTLHQRFYPVLRSSLPDCILPKRAISGDHPVFAAFGARASMSKNIVLLSDGTGNSSAKLFKHIFNVWRLSQILDLSDPARQIVFYDDASARRPSRCLLRLEASSASGLKRNVIDIYASAAATMPR